MTRKDQLKLATQLLALGWLVQPPAGFADSPEPEPAPKGKGKRKGSTMADRVGNDSPDVETVDVHGVTITRVVGSVSEDAPHGRDISGKALAPFGMLSDGSRPRKSAAGRPPAEDTPAAPEPKPAASGGFSLDFGDIDLDLGDSTPAPSKPAPKAKPAPAAEPDAEDLLAGLFADMS